MIYTVNVAILEPLPLRIMLSDHENKYIQSIEAFKGSFSSTHGFLSKAVWSTHSHPQLVMQYCLVMCPSLCIHVRKVPCSSYFTLLNFSHKTLIKF